MVGMQRSRHRPEVAQPPIPGWGSGRLEAREEPEVVGHDRGPDVGLEVIKAAPGATRQAVSALEARDASFDAGTEVAQLAIHPLASDQFLDPEASLLVEGNVGDAQGLC